MVNIMRDALETTHEITKLIKKIAETRLEAGFN